jgi:hypothetical protein
MNKLNPLSIRFILIVYLIIYNNMKIKIKVLNNEKDLAIMGVDETYYKRFASFYDELPKTLKKEDRQFIEFVSKLGVNPFDVKGYDKVVEINKEHLGDLIPKYNAYILHTSKDRRIRRDSYHCFAGLNGHFNNIVIHEDKMSSFKCLLNTLDNPYGIIIVKLSGINKDVMRVEHQAYAEHIEHSLQSI